MSTSLANFVNWHWLNTIFEQGKAVVDLTVIPFEFDASDPPDAYEPVNLQLLK